MGKHEPFDRFLKRQERRYEAVLRSLETGMNVYGCPDWIFPRLRGLATGRKAFVFGILDGCSAKAYLQHPILGDRLTTCCAAILNNKDKTPDEILGQGNARKLHCCATLFAAVSREDSVFHQVLDQFFDGQPDGATLGLLNGRILDLTYRKFLVAVDSAGGWEDHPKICIE